ncbi:hypothetical protein EXIGLDRAFT_735897 [Exidia glandulosa HHB12029]|uniref:Inhibitor I9 domain-containing protein n=1 Tax=Exidia glandulosa HHB12029 TaxID=1314781 RepID=A0A165JNR7_EXIGL|nr:hypothetical protein EXIGLDRAFT_735897 [Exidia glandulosa HHB12029]
MSNSFIVVFKKSASAEQVEEYVNQVSSGGGEVTHRYDAVFKGFAAKLTDTQLQSFQANVAATDSPIDYIEADGVVTTQ